MKDFRARLFRPDTLKRVWFFLLSDLLLSLLTLYFSYLLRFNFEMEEAFFRSFWLFFGVLAVLKLGAFGLFGVYQIPWRFFSLDGLERVAKAHVAAYALFFGGYMLFDSLLGEAMPVFPRSVAFIDFALSMLFIGALRIAKRVVLESQNRSGKAAVIVGAGREGELMARFLYDRASELYPLFFVDEDEEKQGLRIQNLPVIGPGALPELVEKYGIEAAVLALGNATPAQTQKYYELLSGAGIGEVKMARPLADDRAAIAELSIEDLLARAPKDLDQEAIRAFVSGKRVLITGAGGSIGSELARRTLLYGASELALVDSSEFNLYQIGEELAGRAVLLKLVSVTDRAKLAAVFAAFKPQIVLHAAAYKHVPLVEANPKAAVENNITGTINAADLAIEHGVETFVLISTDKAVRPTNIMGATKRVCELYVQNVPSGQTRMTAVRFGNVLGSSGSVVPRFRELIAQNRPLTVTHPEMTRYFMLIGEAVELVLQAASLAQGGEVFVLDMGKPVKIADLASRMLQLSGKTGLGIVYTGLRPGEKLYEELLIEEGDGRTRYPSIFVGRPTPQNISELQSKIDNLLTAEEIPAALKAIVPEFNHNKGAA
ncbi:MAG: polysaccharide biosynthesis protein [Campylobacterales bacterium]